MEPQYPDPAALRRTRTIITAVLGALLVVSVGVALAGVWPVPWLDAVAFSVIGASGLGWRISGTFTVLGGGFVLPVLLVLVLLQNLWRALRGAGPS